MALEKAGINLTLQGEAEYIAGLRAINNETRLLATETKLAVAQLGQGATPTQRFSTEMKHLNAQVQQSQLATKALRNRYRELPGEMRKGRNEIERLTKATESQRVKTQMYHDEMARARRVHGPYSEEVIKATRAYDEQKAILKDLEGELKETTKAYDGMSTELENMPNDIAEATLASQELLNQQAKLREEYIESGGVLAGYADTLESGAEKLRGFGDQLSNLGDRFMGVTMGIIAGGGATLKMFTDWESGFAGVKKTSDELVDANGNVTYSFNQLEEELRSLAKQLPASHTEIAAVAEAAGQLGIQTDNITDFTKVMIDMGESTNLSAEEAATTLARLANITQMSQTDFDRLGSSIVDLGNNFATTEQEIAQMGLRIAGVGNQVGMTEADIMALATAMSSVGIKADAGGTAISQVLKRMQNVSAAHKDMSQKLAEAKKNLGTKEYKKLRQEMEKSEHILAVFANQAQMSASQFAKAFEDDPARALQAFIEGLEKSSNEGANLNEILNELEITGIRESDTLLRLAGNSELLGEAIDTSSKAWEENIALTEEAEVRYETTMSKLRTAWNRLKDSLIDVGAPVADAILDIVDNSEPLFQWFEDVVRGFSEMDQESQRSIMSTVGKIALIAPALKIAGGAMAGMADIFEVGATGIRWAGKHITKSMLETSGEAAAMGTVMANAGGAEGVGALVQVLSGSAAGALPWALGIGAVALGSWALWKIWGEDAYEAAQQTRKWGTTVDEETEKVLNVIQGTEGTYSLLQQGISVDTGLMIGDFQELGRVIEEDVNGRIEATREYMEGLPEMLQESMAEVVEQHYEGLEKTKEIIKKNNEEINAIHKQASDEKREITQGELAYISELQKQSVSEYISTLNLSAEEEKSIRAALAGELNDINNEQAKNLLAVLARENDALEEQRELALQGARETFEGQESLIKEAEGLINEYYDSIGETGQTTIQELIALYPELARQIDLTTGELIIGSDEQRAIQIANNQMIMDSWDDMNMSVRKYANGAIDIQKMMVDNGRLGADVWNKAVRDSNGNIDEFRENIIKATEDSEGWNKIRFQIHEADLDSNARAVIMEAAIMNEHWEGMAWEDKELLMKDNFSATVYKAIRDTEAWNSLEPKEQFAVMTDNYSETVLQGLIDVGKWNKLKPKEQKAILTSNTPEKLIEVLKDIGIWDGLDPKVHNLLLNNTDVKKKKREAKRELDEYGNIVPKKPELKASDQTSAGVNAAQQRINGLTGKTVTLTTKYQSVGSPSAAAAKRFAKGTNFHKGGLAIVNDQLGKTFRELVTLPGGKQFIPTGRNVMLDLPRGSKVLRANLTQQSFPDLPQYKDGVGVQRVEKAPRQSQDNSSNDTYNITINATGELSRQKQLELAKTIEREIKRMNDKKVSSQGGGVSFA